MSGGAVAVELFFVMSGFLITASMLRSRGAWEFLKRRIARIYPAFLACAFVSYVVFAKIGGTSWLNDGWLRNIAVETLRLRPFLYADAFPHNPYPGVINGSLWSVQYEFWCYIGVLLLGIAGLLRHRVLLLAIFFASIIVSVLFLVRGWVLGGKFLGVLLGFPVFWARLLPLYMAGVVFYLWRERIPHRAWLAGLAALTLVIGSVLHLGLAVLFPIAGTYIVFYLAYAPWLRWQNAGRFGDFSYGVYLYAFPVEQCVAKWLGAAASPWKLCAIGTPITLLFAIASWYGVEQHFLRSARKRVTADHAVAAVP